MRIPVPIGPVAYEKALNKLVARFEARIRDLETPRFAADGLIGRVWALLKERPRTRAEVCAALGIADGAEIWKIHSRLEYLVKEGRIERIWQVAVATPYRTKTGTERVRHSQSWVYAPASDSTRNKREVAEREAAKFDAAVEKLEQRRYQITSCFAARALPSVTDDRQRRMVLARLEGRHLEDIAREHGLTRERVRQLVELAVKGRKRGEWRGRAPSPPMSAEILGLLESVRRWGLGPFLAERFSLSPHSVNLRLKARGWPLESQPELLAALQEWAQFQSGIIEPPEEPIAWWLS